MANRVLFESKNPENQKTEFVSRSKTMLTDNPEIFSEDVTCSLNAVFFNFICENQPYFYYRHSNADSVRWVGICKLGDGPFDYQKGGYTYQLACCHKNDKYVMKSDFNDDPYISFGSEDGDLLVTLKNDCASVHEKDIINFKGQYFPITTIDHFNVWPNSSQLYQGAEITGTFEGKPIRGLGRFTRSFVRKSDKSHEFNFDFSSFNTNNELLGIRKDKRKEECVIDILSNGNVWAYYWLEGEEPVWSNKVEVEADWYRLPYLDDGTCCYKEIIFRFAGKEIHVEGKWGHKGFTGYPRFDKKGQAEVCGPWYEGKQKYEHDVYMSFNEVQDAFDYNLSKCGFNVYDVK